MATLRLSQREYERLIGKARRRVVRPQARIEGRIVQPGYVVLTVPLPPSRNREPSNMWALAKLKKQFLEYAWQAWALAGCPRFESVRIEARFYLWNPRDADNSNGIAYKGVLDGLKGHLMPDDDPKHLALDPPIYTVDRKGMRLELHIRAQARNAGMPKPV